MQMIYNYLHTSAQKQKSEKATFVSGDVAKSIAKDLGINRAEGLDRRKADLNG